jgi:hypothetical protein
MSKRDYIILAAALRAALIETVKRHPNERGGVVTAGSYIAQALQRDNREFNRARFMSAAFSEE